MRVDFHVTVERVEGEQLRVLVNDDLLGNYSDDAGGLSVVGDDLALEVLTRLQGPLEPNRGGHVG